MFETPKTDSNEIVVLSRSDKIISDNPYMSSSQERPSNKGRNNLSQSNGIVDLKLNCDINSIVNERPST